jgi:hypothetical protein
MFAAGMTAARSPTVPGVNVVASGVSRVAGGVRIAEGSPLNRSGDRIVTEHLLHIFIGGRQPHHIVGQGCRNVEVCREPFNRHCSRMQAQEAKPECLECGDGVLQLGTNARMLTLECRSPYIVRGFLATISCN